ncbi:MAG TPA: hypothetical protein VHU80_08120 [Polyangiaceae bacterium]|nr:hypothetical protein [Polyangiaceae bacterium]
MTAPSNRAPAPVANDVEMRAEAAYEGALAAYSAGDKQRALELMGQSYALAPHPELLFNLARLRREVGQCEAALASYRSYLAGPNDEASRRAAARASEELDAECGRPEPRATYWTAPRVLGWAAIGGGAVAGVVATYFAVSSAATYSDEQQWINDQSVRGKPSPEYFDGHGAALQARGHRDAVLASVFAGAGAALATGGVLLLVVGPSRAPEHPSVTVNVGPSAALFGFTERF